MRYFSITHYVNDHVPDGEPQAISSDEISVNENVSDADVYGVQTNAVLTIKKVSRKGLC